MIFYRNSRRMLRQPRAGVKPEMEKIYRFSTHHAALEDGPPCWAVPMSGLFQQVEDNDGAGDGSLADAAPAAVTLRRRRRRTSAEDPQAVTDIDACPHCEGTPCIPAWRKLTLGFASSARCRICGQKVTVEVFRALVAMSPPVVLMIMVTSGLLTNPFLTVLGLVVVLAISFTLYLTWVPLRRAEITQRRVVDAARARMAAEQQAKLERRR